MGERLTALMMPRGTGGPRCQGAARAFYRPTLRGENRLELTLSTSLGIRAFNMLWCQALNARKDHRVTHAAMIHDDVCPDDGWLDVLLDELDRTGADLVSAVVPIKNGYGCTSTALDDGTDSWGVRRLTLAEVFALPGTFTGEDAGGRLLVNTGLWVCKFDAAWVEKVCFRDHARIARLPSGEWQAQDVSEDWDFSRQLHALGLDVRATRKVGLYHERPEFTNREPWGAWRTDEAYQKLKA